MSPVTKVLPVNYHQQDEKGYCGAACAQMVLHTMGAGLLAQSGLFTDNRQHSAIVGNDWATAPDGLEWTLNNRRPSNFGEPLMLCALDTEDTLSRRICWTIHQHQTAPPIALIRGGIHWIVVSGYTASAHPTSSSDNSYVIQAFEISNPFPNAPGSAGVPPHQSADGCGTSISRGAAIEHISYARWQFDYMTAVPAWNGKFIAMCNVEAPSIPDEQLRFDRAGPRGGDLLSPHAAASFAVAGLKKYGLFERQGWAGALTGARPAGAVLVERLDLPDSYYWLVPFRSQGRTVAIASVDGRSGDYLQAALLPEGRDSSVTIGSEDALKLVVGKTFELGNNRERLIVRKEALTIYRNLVWRPCLESLSPNYPFFVLNAGGHRLYVRVDGEIFTSLTLDQLGA
jgi:hypothetical protein